MPLPNFRMSGHGLATAVETLVVSQVRPVEVQLRLDEKQRDGNRTWVWRIAIVWYNVEIDVQA